MKVKLGKPITAKHWKIRADLPGACQFQCGMVALYNVSVFWLLHTYCGTGT